MTGWRERPNAITVPAACVTLRDQGGPAKESSTVEKSIAVPTLNCDDDPSDNQSSPAMASASCSADPNDTTTPRSSGQPQDEFAASMKIMLSKSANILRESIEVSGVTFLDASISSFGGRAKLNVSSSNTSSSEDMVGSTYSGTSDHRKEIYCSILGSSSSNHADIANASSHGKLSEGVLRKLLRRYPRGKVFNFDENAYPI
ncbi:hypothetical protein PLIIFM63780_010624 [Purpureocillium lilacinum]|nr:hypothetical protein PLIIFM63780_010624 [Purpureocillium lilacinum]